MINKKTVNNRISQIGNNNKYNKVNKNAILEIKDLMVWYKTYRGSSKVLDGVNMHINVGEKVGLVGESGCGKTTTMKMVLQLLNPIQIQIPKGEIIFNKKDILKMNKIDLMDIRRKHVSMISQEPMVALNPVYSIGQQFQDIIKYSGQYPRASNEEINELSKKAIENVMIPDADRILKSYPYQLSGGMRQRVCIAMSLVTSRDLLIADEPGTALDVTIQDQIHRLLKNLVEKKAVSLIMITHSLGVARELVDRIYVMYAGNIVETSTTKNIFERPSHPYTKGLMRCVPKLSGGGIWEGIYGYVPDYNNPPQGCRFSPRCPDAKEVCSINKPPTYEIAEGHYVACFNFSNTVKRL